MSKSIRRQLPRTISLLLLMSVTAVSAQSAAFGRFEPFGQLEAKLNGTLLEDAEMFQDQRAGAYLVLSSALEEPVLLNARTQSVERVDAAKVLRRDDGSVTLGPAPLLGTVGPFEVEGGDTLAVALAQGRYLTLGAKPHLLGPQSAEAIVAHDASYAYRASKYPVSKDVVAKLREETRQVEVKVYFGSWCPTCARFLPWLMQVEKELEGAPFHFVYYGMPHTMDDPEAKAAGVNAVPTAIISAGGKELGRRTSQGLGIPEKALLEILGGT